MQTDKRLAAASTSSSSHAPRRTPAKRRVSTSSSSSNEGSEQGDELQNDSNSNAAATSSSSTSSHHIAAASSSYADAVKIDEDVLPQKSHQKKQNRPSAASSLSPFTSAATAASSSSKKKKKKKKKSKLAHNNNNYSTHDSLAGNNVMYHGTPTSSSKQQRALDPLDVAAAASHKTLVKYWSQRYTYFTRFDDGCQLDEVGWYSVTPELIAAHQAERMRCDTIIDAYAGVGGNTIQFAMTCHRVFAIEYDLTRLKILRQNARVYGVDKRIEYICGDYLTLIPKLRADCVFLAPPWGGVDYKQKQFDIETMIKPNGFDIFRRTLTITRNIGYCLPRNISPLQVREMSFLQPDPTPADGTVIEPIPAELEENCVGGKVKMMTAYFGELVAQPPSNEDDVAANTSTTSYDANNEE